MADNGSKVAGYSTAVWMDRIGAIAPTESGTMGLREHLDAAINQNANLIQVVIYDLPNRDCNALASNGELLMAQDGFNRYKNEYITPIVQILSDAKYQSLRIIAVIEPDSLPNLVTNLSVPKCQEAKGPGGYVDATRYTLNALYPLKNVYSYVDIGHSGWLGWDNNLSGAATLIADAIKGTTNGVNSVAGFISNTANATPLREPFFDGNTNVGGSPVKSAKFYEWNPHVGEISFVQAFRNAMIAQGFPPSIGMLIDTSRNGWGGANRPAAASTSTSLDTFVNQSRIDRRTHRGMWCNQPSGIGERPTVAPEPGIDAYVWIKPPGESDGVAMAGVIDPTDPAKGFDRFCDPTYVVPATGLPTGALPNAPHAGRWFSDGFRVLLNNAYPPLK
jgi:cellulose 1,4-beta-cellobiosidase